MIYVIYVIHDCHQSIFYDISQKRDVHMDIEVHSGTLDCRSPVPPSPTAMVKRFAIFNVKYLLIFKLCGLPFESYYITTNSFSGSSLSHEVYSLQVDCGSTCLN